MKVQIEMNKLKLFLLSHFLIVAEYLVGFSIKELPPIDEFC